MSAQTVYTNSFPATFGPSYSLPFGTPACNPVSDASGGISPLSSGVSEGGFLGSTSIPLTPGYLAIWAQNAWVSGYRFAYISSPLAPYASPFNPTLSLNDELVTWTFNMRTSVPVSGFGTTQNIVAMVLATDAVNYRIFGNGYAVVFNPAMPQGFQLIRFTSGLMGTVTPLITSSASLSSATNYASIRIVYQQSINQWMMYVRDDGATAFADPSVGVTAAAGSVIDGTYTSTPMSIFGFYANYEMSSSGPEGKMAYFDNYSVTMSCPKIESGGLNTCIGLTTTLSSSTPGGTWTSGTPSVATIGSSSGIVTGMSVGTSIVTHVAGTCSVVAIVTVNPLPVAPAITGTLSICAGATTPLSTIPPPLPGTWSSSTTSVATVNPTTGVVTGISGGTAIISFTIPTGCFSTATVTVTPIPSVITGAATVCIGRTTTWTDTITGGTWSSTDAAVATVGSSTGIITGVNTGTVTISYSVGPGCYTTRVMTVIPSPAAITGTASLCVGATTALANATPGGTWTSSNTSVATIDIATGLVTGVLAGTATISYTAPNGCFETVVATVNPIPNAITGMQTVCVGAQTLLSSSSGGGTWSSGNIAIATVNSTGNVTGVLAGTVNITYTRLGCITTAIVTVNDLPPLIGGPGSVCIGSSITLTNTSAGGTWSSSNAGIATIGIATGIVNTVAVGTTTITYTSSLTGCFRTGTVTVSPLPGAIGGPTTLCPASTVTLTCTPLGGTWASGNTAIATIVPGTGVLTGVATGTATISYTSAAGCLRTTIVTVSSAPPAMITPIGDTVLCPGDFVTLTAGTSPGVTYEWYLGGVLIPAATSPTYIASVGGSYQVRVVVAAGCSTMSAPMSVSVVPATATITVPGGITTTCAGSPIALNANTGIGLTYQWELAGTAISGATASTYNALTAGLYTVRVTNAAGCWAVSTPVSIVVTPAPSGVVTSSGPLTFCNGGNVVLTAATGTGYTYQWYNASGPIAGATAASYTATAPESYHAVIAAPSGCATATAISVVNVNPLPNVTITPGGSSVFCAGGSVLLSATPGFSYQWYRNGVAIPGSISGSYLATTSGGYRVRVTNTSTGCTDLTHADTVVSVVSSPTIVPLTPSKFCWGGSSLLATSVSGLGSALNYQWSFNGVAIVGATSSTYNASVAGVYVCAIAVPLSCTVATGPVSVMQVPLPNPSISFNGTTIKTGNYYVAYQWYKNLVVIPGATSASTPSTGPGTYKVAVTDTNGCQSVSASYVLNSTPPAGVSNLNSAEIKIFPNPTNEMVYVESATALRAVILSTDGKVLIDKENVKEISLKGLVNGMYVIKLYNQEQQQVMVQKLVKQ